MSNFFDKRGDLLNKPSTIHGSDINYKTTNVPTPRRHDGTRYRSHYADGTFETWGETVAIAASGVVTGGSYEINRSRNGITIVSGAIFINPDDGEAFEAVSIVLPFAFSEMLDLFVSVNGVSSSGDITSLIGLGFNSASNAMTATICMPTSTTINMRACLQTGTFAASLRIALGFKVEGRE